MRGSVIINLTIIGTAHEQSDYLGKNMRQKNEIELKKFEEYHDIHDIKELEKVTDNIEENDDLYYYALCYNSYCKMIYGKFEKIDEDLEICYKKFIEAEDFKGKALAIRFQGHFYWRQGHYDICKTKCHEAYELCKDANDDKGMGKSYLLLAHAHRSKGNYIEGLDCFYKSIYYFQNIPDDKGIGLSYLGIADILRSIGYLDKAFQFYQRSKDLLEKIQYSHGLASVYVNLGNVFRIKNEYDKSNEYYYKSKIIRDKASDIRGIINCKMGIGANFLALEKYDKAEEYFKDILNDINRCGNIYGEIEIQYYLGKLYYNRNKTKDLQESINILEEAFEKARKIFADSLVYKICYELSMIYSEVNNDKKAIKNLWECLNVKKKLEKVEENNFIIISKFEECEHLKENLNKMRISSSISS